MSTKPATDTAAAAAAVRQAGTHLTHQLGKRRKNAEKKAQKLEEFTEVDGESTLYGIVEKNLGGTTLLVKTIVKGKASKEIKCRIPGKYRGKCKLLITPGDYVIITIDGETSVNGEIVAPISRETARKRKLQTDSEDIKKDEGFEFEAEESEAEVDIDAI